MTDLPLAASLSPYFTGLVIDADPWLLDDSYRLRYQVYCHERHFLNATDYPDGREIDRYDAHSTHLAVVNLAGELVATTRLVAWSELGLPLLEHCVIVPEDRLRDYPRRGMVEISRLSVSRRYNRRAGDGYYSLSGPDPSKAAQERRHGGEIVLALCKAVYQESKRRGYTHWLMAGEKTLRRLLMRYGLPFRRIGPDSDYYGIVSPYAMDLAKFDQVIASGQFPILRDFLEGLETRFHPALEAQPDSGTLP